MRSLRPKNLETKRVALPWASGLWIQSKHGLRMQFSLHPLLRTLQPLQLILVDEECFAFPFYLFYSFSSGFLEPKGKEERERENGVGVNYSASGGSSVWSKVVGKSNSGWV